MTYKIKRKEKRYEVFSNVNSVELNAYSKKDAKKKGLTEIKNMLVVKEIK